MKRRTLLLSLLAAPLAARAGASEWSAILERARGQTVFFNAWGGDDATNGFIAWAGERVSALHGVNVRHVRLRDTAEAVARVVAERAAGRDSGGSVDLIWINGPNFLAMKQQRLLHGPFTQALPNFALVDAAGKPAVLVDFTVPVEGLAAPWRMAQIAYVYDSARVPNPPRSIIALGEWAAANPGRLTHPTARNFLGATFLKQALYELIEERSVLMQPVDSADFARATEGLWRWYEALRPNLWRRGRHFPESGPAQRQLLNDGEIDIMISFNPAEAALAIARGQLPDTARVTGLAAGTIGNASFVAIPYNASHRDGAMVLANFLMSPEAQAHAADPRVLGAMTVLDLARIPEEQRRRFDHSATSPAMPSPGALGAPLPEPHPSWMTRIVYQWERRTAN
jgi:putative thiamine transport system substrate-binding protein